MKNLTQHDASVPSCDDSSNDKGKLFETLECAVSDSMVTEAEVDKTPRGVRGTNSAIIEVRAADIVITVQSNASESEVVVKDPARAIVHVVRHRKGREADGQTAHSVPAPHIRISKTAFEKVRETVGNLPAERGGIFVGPDPFCIEDFIFDEGTKANRSAVYYPDTTYLNEILEREHEPLGRRFVGLAHSHPNGYWHPSGDAEWAMSRPRRIT